VGEQAQGRPAGAIGMDIAVAVMSIARPRFMRSMWSPA
jgi:hypothetical protein